MKQSPLLKRILAAKRAEIARARRERPMVQVMDLLAKAPPTRNFRDAIMRKRPYEIHLIGELKKASPVKGVIRQKLDIPGLVGEFEGAGVSALSVLTDEKFFQGSIDNLRRAKEACGLPVMRKDFLVDEYQVYESRLVGADAVLLIVRLLAQRKLKDMIRLVRNLGMAAMVEVHTTADLRRAIDAQADTIGINTRDLGTFRINERVAEEVRPMIPAGCVAVCESGVGSPRQIHELRELRFDAVLIGEALMRTRKPATLIHELLHT